MNNLHVAHALLALLTLPLLASCHRCVYEDLTDCPQGVDFALEVQTPCMASPTYPSDITEAHLFAFDEEGRLVWDQAVSDLQLSEDYLLRTDYYRVGETRFDVWAGADLSQYDFSAFTPGTTTREEITLSLRRQTEGSHTGSLAPLYHGVPVDGPLVQVERAHLGSVYDRVTIRLTQVTNRLQLVLRGLSSRHKYTVHVEDDNDRYRVDGSFAGRDRLHYLPDDLQQRGDVVTATIDVMRLATGRRAMLVVTDTTTGREVFRRNLIEELLLAPAPNADERGYSLDCTHMFHITILFETKDDDDDEETHVAIRATINKWNLVFRSVIL